MSDHDIQLGMFITQIVVGIVSIGAFCGLVWYTIETKIMRKAAEAQVTLSQRIITAAMDQVEGLSKPCLTLEGELRDARDAIVGLGVIGSIVAKGSTDGCFIIHNIGNGPALNVNYQFLSTGDLKFKPSQSVRYVQTVLTGQRVQMVEMLNLYGAEFDVIFHYESIGGRKYESKISISGLVLAKFGFRELIE